MLRSSEFWIALAAAVGSLLAGFKIIPQKEWDQFLYPAIVYVIGRLTSKTAKAIIR